MSRLNIGHRHLLPIYPAIFIDWGQDLPGLKIWFDEHKSKVAEGQPYLAYFGTADPSWYGINAIRLREDCSNETPSPLKPGIYCISATTLQQLYVVKQDKWAQPYEAAYQVALKYMQQYEELSPQNRTGLSKAFQRLRFGRLCAYLRHRQPIAKVGYSILLFHLSEHDLRAALYGPPAELTSKISVIAE